MQTHEERAAMEPLVSTVRGVRIELRPWLMSGGWAWLITEPDGTVEDYRTNTAFEGLWRGRSDGSWDQIKGTGQASMPSDPRKAMKVLEMRVGRAEAARRLAEIADRAGTVRWTPVGPISGPVARVVSDDGREGVRAVHWNAFRQPRLFGPAYDPDTRAILDPEPMKD